MERSPKTKRTKTKWSCLGRGQLEGQQLVSAFLHGCHLPFPARLVLLRTGLAPHCNVQAKVASLVHIDDYRDVPNEEDNAGRSRLLDMESGQDRRCLNDMNSHA